MENGLYTLANGVSRHELRTIKGNPANSASILPRRLATHARAVPDRPALSEEDGLTYKALRIHLLQVSPDVYGTV